MQNQSNSLITFDTQLKTALCREISCIWQMQECLVRQAADGNVAENWRENHGHLVTFAVHISGKRDASSL